MRSRPFEVRSYSPRNVSLRGMAEVWISVWMVGWYAFPDPCRGFPLVCGTASRFMSGVRPRNVLRIFFATEECTMNTTLRSVVASLGTGLCFAVPALSQEVLLTSEATLDTEAIVDYVSDVERRR